MLGNVRSKKAKNSELLAQRKKALFSRTLRTFPGNACSVFHNFLTFPLEGCLSTRVEPVHLLSALVKEHCTVGKILTLRMILFFKRAFQSQFGECMQMFSVELATVKSVDYIDQKIVPTDANEKKV